ncbi:SpoIIE family protein phosphatase [candidate division KSB1 bacterium]
MEISTDIGRIKEIDKGLMELTSLFEISKTLSSTLNLQSVLNNILLTPMGRMMIGRGSVLLSENDNVYVFQSGKGLPLDLKDSKIIVEDLPESHFDVANLINKEIEWADFLYKYKLLYGFPIKSKNNVLGFLIFGKKLSGKEFTENEMNFLDSLSNLSATAIQNSVMFQELLEVNRRLDQTNQKLNTLFDIGKEFNTTFDENKIIKLFGFALMGQLLVNKFALLIRHNDKFTIKGSKGCKLEQRKLDEDSMALDFLIGLKGTYYVNDSDETCFSNNNIKLLIPMISQGETKGVICLGEKIGKRDYNESEIEFLETLGNQTLVSIENAELIKQMLEKNRIEEELALAREIQSGLLPQKVPKVSGIQLEAVNISSRFVGGDYYDMIELKDASQGIAIADVSGKGVGASLLMANLQATFRALSEVILDPALLVEKINNIIYENTSSDKFITLFYARFHREKLRLEYCNAGHNYPIVLSREGKIELLKEGGLIIGMMPDVKYQKGSVSLKSGDVVVMYTDGITEALNPENEEFGEERLVELCQENTDKSAEFLRNLILLEVEKFCNGTPQYDDMTMVILKVE